MDGLSEAAEKCTASGENLLAALVGAQEAMARAGLCPDLVAQTAAEQAMALASADGAVVELVDGEELVYTAGAGTAAENVGFRLSIHGSLSGRCLRENEALLCADVESDPRVDKVAARRLGIRSMVVVPLQHSGEVRGVLKVLSGRPDAFDIQTLEVLRVTSGLLGTGLGQALEFASRVAAEQESRLSQERLRLALDIANLGTWDWDIQQNTVAWSDNIESLHGMASGTFDGTYEGWFSLVHPADRDRVGALVAEALNRDDGYYDAEFRITTPDKSVRWMRGRGQVYFDEQGTPVRMIGTAVDVTERHRAMEDLRRARDEAVEARGAAEAANAAKSEFLSRMSHELRTPLNAVLGFAQLLETEVAEAHRSSVAHIRQAGTHLLDLINEVLDIARIESGYLSLSPEPVAVADVVRETVDLVLPMAQQSGIRVIAGEAESSSEHIIADRQRIKQVLLNLLSNAIKYNRPGGDVVVTCERVVTGDGPALSIHVRDTGVGIAAADLVLLFVPFERLGAERTDIQGTGVGLALSQRLVEAMGGTIDVSSRVGHGSTFTVTMTLAEEITPIFGDPRPTVPAVPSAPLPPATARTLLYIEDNGSNAILLDHLVSRLPGWRLETATQGQVGLELAQSLAAGSGVDLLLLDLHLPEMTGMEVLRRLRANPLTADLPVVVLSADATRGLARRVLAAGADRFVTKPLDISEILEVIDRATRGESLAG